jgi:predicted amino acid racemase
MFLNAVLRRNPALIDAAVELHRSGAIPPNCYVVDVDAVGRNAGLIAARARELGLACLQMTKQFGRNPLIARAVAAAGIPQAVAVDIDEARTLHDAGVAIGHLGHLVQIPVSALPGAMRLAPGQITVFGAEQARLVAAAARGAGREQPVLVRVVGPDDFFYPAQRGGVPLDDLAVTVREIERLDGVSFAGLTSFPCLLWDGEAGRIRPTPNLATLGKAARMLPDAIAGTAVINAPSANCVATLETLAAAGATQVEPGSALIGQTPLHAASDQPEIPAMVYVSEVTHSLDDETFTLGGGFYARSRVRHAVVDTATGRHLADAQPSPPGEIDYYGALRLPAGARAEIGDTAVYSFRSQVFVTRASVAVVTGVGDRPTVLGRFGPDGRPAGACDQPTQTRHSGREQGGDR